jgi:hypothetical protein
MSDGALPLIRQREIEARIAAALIDGFSRQMGEAAALETAAGVIRQQAREAGRAVAQRCGADGLRELAAAVADIFAAADALTVDLLESSTTKLHFNVTACRYVRMYENLGLRHLGGILSCQRDAAFSAGFNPRIRFRRSQTIMDGAAFCDFRYELD